MAWYSFGYLDYPTSRLGCGLYTGFVRAVNRKLYEGLKNWRRGQGKRVNDVNDRGQQIEEVGRFDSAVIMIPTNRELRDVLPRQQVVASADFNARFPGLRRGRHCGASCRAPVSGRLGLAAAGRTETVVRAGRVLRVPAPQPDRRARLLGRRLPVLAREAQPVRRGLREG